MKYHNDGRLGGGLLKSERELEEMIRSFPCPTCEAEPLKPCWNTVENDGVKKWSVSHWRRRKVYEEAQ
jgi:hypothetical protein